MKTQHQAIQEIHDAIFHITGTLNLPSLSNPASALHVTVSDDPSEPHSNNKILRNKFETLELHAQNVPDLKGNPTNRWNYTIITIGPLSNAHDDPVPLIEHTKPMPLLDAAKAFTSELLAQAIDSIPFHTFPEYQNH